MLHWKDTNAHIYISMIDLAPSVDNCHQIWSYMMCLMRKVGVPQIFFGLTLVSSGPYEVFVTDGIRHLRQITYIPETQLGDWDSRDINQRLWMASQGHHRTWRERLLSDWSKILIFRVGIFCQPFLPSGV